MSADRHMTHRVQIGSVVMGAGSPIVVQSMTNTPTADIAATVAQIADLVAAGAELVRLTVNDRQAAEAIPRIAKALDQQGIQVPLIGDFHYNGAQLLADHPECAQCLAKYRINPGNLGEGAKRDRHFEAFIELAVRYQKPVRIGVNWGSLDKSLLARRLAENDLLSQPLTGQQIMKQVMVESALESAKQAEQLGLSPNQIVLSCKVSQVPDLIDIYRDLAARSEYALHVGLTEAGMGLQGMVSSSAALGILLNEGIGDTIRVSLTPEPGQCRSREVLVAREILQALQLRAFSPRITACPGCGRTDSAEYLELAETIRHFIDTQMPEWKTRYPGIENLTIAVMGCVVNGPGESRHADIGISLPGKSEDPKAPVYVDGKKTAVLQGPTIATEFEQIISAYVQARYGHQIH